MEEDETLELYDLHYSDLMALSASDHQSPPTSEKMEHLESVKSAIMKTLGPAGPGLLAINGVSKASILRQNLLPMARKLALLNNEDRKLVLKVFNFENEIKINCCFENVAYVFDEMTE